MATAAPIIAAFAAAGSAATSRSAGKRQQRAQRQDAKLQRLREGRERKRLFADRQRALAEVQSQIGARGAASSSAASTVPGSIISQEAGQQQFLSTVGTISAKANAFRSEAQNLQSNSQLIQTFGSFVSQGAQQGLFFTPKAEG